VLVRSIFLSLTLIQACASPEELACTDIGCTDGLHISLLREAFEPGLYLVELDLHGEVILCQATIPLGSGASDGCSDPRAWLELSGSELDTSEQAVTGVFLDRTDLSAMAITVLQDDEEIGYAAFEPDYQTLQPNGPECEPTCAYATRELELD
jgi:hypothetical protein